MNQNIENLLNKATDLIPKGGAWITLNNLQLAINIFFDTAWQTLKLGLAIAGIYYVYTITPELQALINLLLK
jgi:hypothetical protein